MDNLLKVKRITWFTTIFDGILMVVSLISTAVCVTFLMTNSFFSQTSEILENAPNHDLTGGYEILGGLFFGFLEGVVVAILLLAIAVCVVMFVLSLVCTISGIISLSRSNKMGIYTFKTDALIKMIIHGIVAVLIVFFGIKNEIYISILIALPFAIIVLLSYLVKDAMKSLNA